MWFKKQGQPIVAPMLLPVCSMCQHCVPLEDSTVQVEVVHMPYNRENNRRTWVTDTLTFSCSCWNQVYGAGKPPFNLVHLATDDTHYYAKKTIEGLGTPVLVDIGLPDIQCEGGWLSSHAAILTAVMRRSTAVTKDPLEEEVC